jgi:hypothetical protein
VLVRYLAGLLILGTALVGVVSASAEASPQTNLRATLVTIPPKVQSAGSTYRLRVRVTNRGSTFKPLCFDFTDDNDSWLIEAPGRHAYHSDTFCAGTILRGQTKTIPFLVTAAETGAHRMTIMIGKADLPGLNRAYITDSDALFWEGNFVIV